MMKLCTSRDDFKLIKLQYMLWKDDPQTMAKKSICVFLKKSGTILALGFGLIAIKIIRMENNMIPNEQESIDFK